LIEGQITNSTREIWRMVVLGLKEQEGVVMGEDILQEDSPPGKRHILDGRNVL